MSKLINYLFISLSLIVLSSCFNARQEDVSSGKFVNIDQTPIKDQGDVGFCWAYTAIAMIEADYLAKTGQSIDLSEEALGYFLIAHQFEGYVNCALKYGDCSDWDFGEGGIAGSSSTTGYDFHPKFAGDLIERWGLIPESIWTTKFNYQNNSFQKLYPIVQIEIEKLVEELKISGQNTVQMNQIFDVMNRKLFHSTPPVDGFDNGSGQMNAVQYAKNVIGFTKAGFRTSSFNRGFPLKTVDIKDVLTSLRQGKSVGIGISTPENLSERLKGRVFEGAGSSYKVGGGHAMLITDFKNANSLYGDLGETVEQVFEGGNLDSRFKLKNSWGDGVNEFGSQVQAGYYEMDFQYIADTLVSDDGQLEFVYYDSKL